MIAPERAPIVVGQPVIVGLQAGDVTRWHDGRVTAREQDCLWVDTAVDRSRDLLGLTGKEIVLETWRPADARYRFTARVLAVEVVPQPCLNLRIGSGTRIQRRAHFRVPVSLVAEAAAIVNQEGQETAIELRLRDLSAGGMRAACNVALPPAAQLRCVLALPGDERRLELRAQVVRVVEGESNGRFACEVGARFLEVPAAVAERLTRFTLAIQAELIRRGNVG